MQTRFTVILPLLLGACDVQEATQEEFRNGESYEPEVIAAFNPAFGETPESVALDRDNNAFVSLALTGEIRKVAPDGTQSSHAFIPLGQCQPNPFPPIMGAIAIDLFQNLYVNAAACDAGNRGVWRVTPQGVSSLVARVPADALPNGIAIHGGRAYVADSGSPRIFRTPTWVSGADAEVWTTSPLLADPNPFDLVPGSNGLQFYCDEVFVANAGAGTIVAIPLEEGGGLFDFVAGEAYVKYGPAESGAEIETPPEFPGCDDFAFDLQGRIYCTTDPFQSVLRINLDGSIDAILLPEDGIDGPTAAAFGRRSQRFDLYVTNASFPFPGFPTTGHGPSLMKLEVDVAGYPFR